MPSPNDPHSQDSFHTLRKFCMLMACICIVSVFVLCYYRHWMPALVAAALTLLFALILLRTRRNSVDQEMAYDADRSDEPDALDLLAEYDSETAQAARHSAQPQSRSGNPYLDMAVALRKHLAIRELREAAWQSMESVESTTRDTTSNTD
ncbi:hypothetical protein [Bifidobacterium animalis]|uniref:hypothetical protein n=1 Tax=Bifidobacterium animalis TaxID=28025 RepID=UPI00080C64BD|nr:hypothetical protein [Bifidobacterium animalis]QQQ90381.1 hypothetical protein I5Q88_00605 [Bifidobacterium animalis]UQE63480.1 hypothetical protein M2855_00600 [Bifidobacterium animalis]